MLWFLLSLLTALSVATHDTWIKRYYSHLSPYEMSAYPFLYSLPPIGATLVFVPVPPLDVTFWWCFVVSIPLNAVSFLVYMHAIKLSPLSLTVPYLAFTPAFMIVTGYLFLGEMPSFQGMAGILVICAGGYTLNIDPRRWTLWAPLAAVWREPGSRQMLGVAFIYSFASVIGKKGILHSSPLFFNLFFFTVFNLSVLILLRITGRIRLSHFRESPAKGMVAGLLFFFHALFHGLAISMTQAAYMISVKRLSILFSVFYGKLVFREANIIFRFNGALLMLLGTLLITLQGW